MSTIEQLKKSRRVFSRVKTGCTTCKARRVKCDESKPACSKCTSTGRKCDGYELNISTSSTKWAQSLVPIDFARPRSSLSSVLSGFGENIQYLEFYHHCAVSNLASYYDTEFWSRIAMQMAQREPTVRHALIGLSYLCKTESGNMKEARRNLLDASRHRTLLKHYTKSVGCLAKRMAEPTYTPEIGLVACILYICIEFIRGDYRTAFSHMKSGLRIIAEWQKKNAIVYLEPKKDPRSKTITAPPTWTHNASDMIEAKLIPMFIRLIAAALIYGAEVEQVFAIHCLTVSEFQSQPFTTIAEAQYTLHDLRNTSILFIRQTGQKTFLLGPSTVSSDDVKFWQQLTETHRSWLECFENLLRHRPSRIMSEQEKVIASTLRVSYHSQWILLMVCLITNPMQYDALLDHFEIILRHSAIVIESMNLPPAPKPPNLLPLPTFRSAGSSLPSSSSGILPSRPLISTPPPIPPSAPPSSTPSDLQLIAATSPTTPSSPTKAAHFTFDISVIPSIFYTVCHCRSPRVRREALRLLTLNPPREGLWDAERAVIVGRRVIEVEEAELDPVTGWPVERVRLFQVVIGGDVDEKGQFHLSMTGGPYFAPRGRLFGTVPGAREWKEWYTLKEPFEYEFDYSE